MVHRWIICIDYLRVSLIIEEVLSRSQGWKFNYAATLLSGPFKNAESQLLIWGAVFPQEIIIFAPPSRLRVCVSVNEGA